MHHPTPAEIVVLCLIGGGYAAFMIGLLTVTIDQAISAHRRPQPQVKRSVTPARRVAEARKPA